MTLVSMKKVVRQSWDEIPMPETLILQVNALSEGKINNLDLLDDKKSPIGELEITGVDCG